MSDPTPLLSRLLLFIKSQGLNKNRFELACGISRGYLSNVKGEVGSSVMMKILNAYPSLNKDWLLTGNGPMLISVDKPLSDSHVQDVSGSGINITTAPSSSSPISIEQSKQITLLIEENIKQGARIDRLISLLEHK